MNEPGLAKSSKLAAPLLSVKSLTKKFGDFAALKQVDLDIAFGEVHALLGENGAGKSTLVKILYGSLQPTEGQVLWKGNPVHITSPAEARAMGIGMVFQHFSLFEALSVAENIALSMPEDFPLSRIEAEAVACSEKYGLPVNPSALVGDLSVGERQRVEIVRCLLQEPELLILDEPTSVLTPQEADNLFKTVHQLKDEGKAVLFISHRLEEVRQHCDGATVLRFGEVVGECNPRDETAATLARLMVGEDVSSIKKKSGGEYGEPVLSLNNLTTSPTSPFAVALDNVNLEVRKGEIVSIAGIAGNGQSELFEAICGELTVHDADAVVIRGNNAGRLGINRRRALGAAFVPEERNGHGAVGGLNLSDNMLLARHSSDKVAFLRGGVLGLIWNEMIMKAMRRVSGEMDVRKSSDNPQASSLSGGNLQKYIVGREFDRQPELIVVNQPTWGVDAGAARRIRQGLVDLANSGSAVLVLSQDLDEIFEFSDSIAVLFEGKLSQSRPASEFDREKIGLLMAGIGIDGTGKETSDVA